MHNHDKLQSYHNNTIQLRRGGLRKIRWNIEGQGKRGSVRVIYYWLTKDEQIFMLYAYKKNAQENLSKDQLKMLKRIVEEELQS